MIIRTEVEADHEAIMALIYAAFLNHPHHAPGAKPTEHLIYKGLKEHGDLTLSFESEQPAEEVSQNPAGILAELAERFREN